MTALSLVQGSFLSTRVAFGEPWEVFGMVPGWPEQVPGLFMMPMESARQPTSDWDLRFLIFLAHLSIRAHDLQCFCALGRFRCTLVLPNSISVNISINMNININININISISIRI